MSLQPVRQIADLVRRLYHSPSAMTAASVAARAFGIAAPLPFLYATLPVEAVAFWLSVTTFQSLAGAFAGIVPTVAMQMIAYARTGSTALAGSMSDHSRRRKSEPNWQLMADVNRTTVRLFFAITAAWFLFSAIIGTWVIWRPMAASGQIYDAAGAWVIFILGSAIRLMAQPYGAFGQGLGAVAQLRRLEAFSWLIGGVAAIIVLAGTANLVLAMLAIQAPVLLNYIQFRRLAREKGWSTDGSTPGKQVMQELWPRSWRGGIAALASMLTIYGVGFIYAQVGDSEATAAYLLALNILGIVGQVALSPVLAATPTLASLFAKSEQAEMNRVAQRAIGRSMWIFVLLASTVPVAVFVANSMLPVPVGFPDPWLWLAMCLSAIMLRHSADHLLYYTTTNDIRGHVINPVFLVVSLGPFLILPASSAMLLVAVQGLAAALLHFPYSRGLTWKRLGYGLDREVRDFLFPLGVMLAALGAMALASQP